jgi:uncharacterized protein (DUF433 family)
MVLADIPEERKVRKDIERGVLEPWKRWNTSIFFHVAHVICLAAVYKNSSLPREMRKTAIDKFESSFERANIFERWTSFSCHSRDLITSWAAEENMCINLDRLLFFDLKPLLADVAPRICIYAEGLLRIEAKNGVMGGEPVFKGTRLPVRHIGKMIDDGEEISVVLEDYPYLTEPDARFAHLYYLANPPLGRPAKEAEVGYGSAAIG